MSKAFDCIPYYLLIAKLPAHGLSEEALIHILSYISNHKQCGIIYNTYSEIEKIITGVSQECILVPI